VKNSLTFVNKIKDFTVPPGSVMISLDVESLFTSVPVDLFLKCMKKNWERIASITEIDQDLFISMISFVLKSSYFQYDGKFFHQIHGFAMGLCPAPIATQYVMESLIDTVLTECGVDVDFLALYVDDLFLILDEDEVENTLTMFNSINSNIKFTIEYEKEREINFLDVKIKRELDGERSKNFDT
jgi:hypothetical protein